MNNLTEHLLAATCLLVSAEPIKHRLTRAYIQHLEPVDQADVPTELRKEFTELTHELTCIKPMRGETAVQATVRKMSDLQASSCASRIVELLATLANLHTRPKQTVLRAVKLGAE